MLKPALFAVTGALVIFSAWLSKATPSTLTAGQLCAMALVYGIMPLQKPPADIKHYHEYLSVGALLFLSKLFSYWVLCISGPLVGQAAFFVVPITIFAFGYAFSNSYSFDLDKVEIALQVLQVIVVIVLVFARTDFNPIGAVLALVTTIISGFYSAASTIFISKEVDHGVVVIRALVYSNAAIFALIVWAYTFEIPEKILPFALFLAASFMHALIRKWHDTEEGANGTKFSGEWSALRAILVLTFAWSTDWIGSLLVFTLATLMHAYYSRHRRERLLFEMQQEEPVLLDDSSHE